jgi:excinuclease UvrABC nuclease subunit
MVIDIFTNYLHPSELVELERTNTSLNDIDGIGNGTVQTLQETGYETLDDVRSATVEELQELENIGEGIAKKLVNA